VAVSKLERMKINGHVKNMNVGEEKKPGLEYEGENLFRYLHRDGRLILKYILQIHI
jgi:hypothetical protein